VYYTIWQLFAKKTLQKLKKFNKMKNVNKNVILYCRATLNKPSDVFTIKYEQENRLLNLCAIYGYNVVKVFTDCNSKTTNINNQLQNMKEFAKNNAETVSAVICESFDRISRKYKETLDTIMDFEEIGIDLISIKQLTNNKNNSNEQ
jgi:DNA invertase Pin-like site-specific DNA recombinase